MLTLSLLYCIFQVGCGPKLFNLVPISLEFNYSELGYSKK